MIWINYNNSLTWNKVIFGDTPTNHHSWGRTGFRSNLPRYFHGFYQFSTSFYGFHWGWFAIDPRNPHHHGAFQQRSESRSRCPVLSASTGSPALFPGVGIQHSSAAERGRARGLGRVEIFKNKQRDWKVWKICVAGWIYIYICVCVCVYVICIYIYDTMCIYIYA